MDLRIPVIVKADGDNIAIFLVLECFKRNTLTFSIKVIAEELYVIVINQSERSEELWAHLKPLEDDVHFLVG